MFFFDLEAEARRRYASERIFIVDKSGLSVVQSKLPHVVGMKCKSR